MDLVVFNIMTGILLIVAAIGLALLLHWNIDSTDDSWIRNRCRCGYMFSLFLIFMGIYKLCYRDYASSFPEMKSVSDAIAFAFMGILISGIPLLVQVYKKRKACYGFIGGYIFGGAMLAVSIVCWVSTLIS